MNRTKRVELAAPVFVGLAILLLWEGLCRGLDVPVFLVPSPTAVGRSLAADFPMLFASLLVTLKITFLKFVTAVVLGSLIAFAFVQSRVLLFMAMQALSTLALGHWHDSEAKQER